MPTKAYKNHRPLNTPLKLDLGKRPLNFWFTKYYGDEFLMHYRILKFKLETKTGWLAMVL